MGSVRFDGYWTWVRFASVGTTLGFVRFGIAQTQGSSSVCSVCSVRFPPLNSTRDETARPTGLAGTTSGTSSGLENRKSVAMKTSRRKSERRR